MLNINDPAKPTEFSSEADVSHEEDPVSVVLVKNAEPSLSDLNLSSLKDEESFAIIPADGNIRPGGKGTVEGLYYKDMRYISGLDVTFDVPVIRITEGMSGVSDDRTQFAAHFVDVSGTLGVSSTLFVHDKALHRAVEIRNQGDSSRKVNFHVSCDSDFIDMFPLRGPSDFQKIYDRAHPGRDYGPLGQGGTLTGTLNAVAKNYYGLDREERKSFVHFSEDGVENEGNIRSFACTLEPGEGKTLYIEAGAGEGPAEPASAQRFQRALSALHDKRAELISGGVTVQYGNGDMNQWRASSDADLALLTNHYDTGLYPCAGMPWFSVPFGRDGIITAMEVLWERPDYAAGVLRYLAKHQAQDTDPDIEAEPGKIMHETRECETVRATDPDTGKPLKPFKRYYGGADTTLLFVMLAGQYYERTGDGKLVSELWPNIERALEWTKSKMADDGFVGYTKNGETGLENQNWQDSKDSAFYENGDYDLAYPRKELTVQGYGYSALMAGQRFAHMAGKTQDALDYGAMAAMLKAELNARFWNEDKGAYAHAVDGNGVPCPETKSSSGHIIFTGAVPKERAESIAGVLLAPRFFNGGGIRTLHNESLRYDPDGYHNGGMWPHDNALIADGFQRNGLYAEARTIIEGQQCVAGQFGNRSLPELTNGNVTADGRFQKFGSACDPQAWAVAAQSKLTQVALGLRIDALADVPEIHVDPSAMPEAWGTVRVNRLAVGGGTVTFETSADGPVTVLAHEGAPVRVIDSRTNMDMPVPVAPSTRLSVTVATPA